MRLKRIAAALSITLVCLGLSHAQYPAATPMPSDTNWMRTDTTDTAATNTQTIAGGPEARVVRRTYNYRTQVVLAVFMMCFAALALTSVDAFNPE